MRNEADSIAALFRRALRRRPDVAELERREVRRLVRRAIKRQQQRHVRAMLRAAFARALDALANIVWTSGGHGPCAECGGDEPPHPFWSKRRPRYVVCPRGHRVHVDCLDVQAIAGEPGVEATCPRCPGS
jgi:hypothetical protein